MSAKKGEREEIIAGCRRGIREEKGNLNKRKLGSKRLALKKEKEGRKRKRKANKREEEEGSLS